jgi:hypothetical protein
VSDHGLQLGDHVYLEQVGYGRVVFINERRESGHIVFMPDPRNWFDRYVLGPNGVDTNAAHVRKLSLLEVLAREAAGLC